MIAAVLRELIAAGVTGDALVTAIERIEAAIYPARSAGAARTARWRERHKASQNVTVTATPSQVSPSFSPSTPTPITTPSSLSPSSLRSDSLESDFPKDFREQFWSLYPRKVGKKAAIRKLELVRRNDEIPWASLVSAIGRIDTKDPRFIPHPTTWLNEGRYLDQIGASPPADIRPAWMTPPPGAISYLDKMRRNGDGSAIGAEIRGDAGLGAEGANNPSELPLPSGGALRAS